MYYMIIVNTCLLTDGQRKMYALMGVTPPRRLCKGNCACVQGTGGPLGSILRVFSCLAITAPYCRPMSRVCSKLCVSPLRSAHNHPLCTKVAMKFHMVPYASPMCMRHQRRKLRPVKRQLFQPLAMVAAPNGEVETRSSNKYVED